MKVVIVENEFITQLHLENMMKSLGHYVSGCASNYDDAIEIIKTNKPDIILLDIGLEGKKNGIDVAHDSAKINPVNVIYITANLDKNTMSKILKTHHLGIIQKPFENISFEAKFLELTKELHSC